MEGRLRAPFDPDSTVPEAADGPADGPRLGHRYELRGVLGRGGQGDVWRVHDRDLGRDVAMKVMRARPGADVGRFLAEAQVTAQLVHPGLAPVFDLGRLPDGELYYTMPVLRGRTLSAVLADPAPPSLRRRVALLSAVCRAVAHAHGAGVIHRDVKPDNVLVGDDGAVTVVDFGLAGLRPGGVVATDRARSGDRTVEGAVAGTPAYMAPEAAIGAVTEAAADVYALGAMLHELLEDAGGTVLLHVHLPSAAAALRDHPAVAGRSAQALARLLAHHPAVRSQRARRAGQRDRRWWTLDVTGWARP